MTVTALMPSASVSVAAMVNPRSPRQRTDAITDISPQILEPVERPSHRAALERRDPHAMFTGHCPEVECQLDLGVKPPEGSTHP